ncbi:MAG: IS3 family transposase, partial [Gammaproteobacteria bacterium]|nr:IS3 family transposase [Gammaproteobacteria bacterium]
MAATENLSGAVGVAPACESMGVARSTLYYQRQPKQEPKPKPKPARALTDGERQKVLDELHGDRFLDKSPGEVWATLLDEGTYLCSERTMYRILADNEEVKERRNQLKHPEYTKPELLAEGPNEVWSWDITKLRGPVKWTYFYLYVILDIFSRYVVGWMVAPRETAHLAQKLIRESCKKQAIDPGQLTIHADRGSPMIAKTTAQLFVTLGINKSHSRPHVSDDNPYSESQFKTLKYCPGFPDRFGSLQDAVAFCRSFFTWYNTEHRHSGIGMLTPEVVHYGLARDVVE